MQLVAHDNNTGSIVDISNDELMLLIDLMANKYKVIYAMTAMSYKDQYDAFKQVHISIDQTVPSDDVIDEMMKLQNANFEKEVAILYNFFKENDLLDCIK